MSERRFISLSIQASVSDLATVALVAGLLLQRVDERQRARLRAILRAILQSMPYLCQPAAACTVTR